jgi:hypothetical protein
MRLAEKLDWKGLRQLLHCKINFTETTYEQNFVITEYGMLVKVTDVQE